MILNITLQILQMVNNKMKPIDAAIFQMDGYQKFSDRELLNFVLDFEKTEERFTSGTFIKDLDKRLNDGKNLTNKQKLAIVKIISRWRIPIK